VLLSSKLSESDENENGELPLDWDSAIFTGDVTNRISDPIQLDPALFFRNQSLCTALLDPHRGVSASPSSSSSSSAATTRFVATKPTFKKYGAQIVKNAQALAKDLVGYGFNLVSGGTDNHLLLIDLKNKGITGTDAEKLLDEAGLIANRNTVPGDDKPFNPSGIRMGTPSVTSRGMKEKEMKMVAAWIYRLIDEKEKPAKIRKEVATLCKKFSLPY
jgi:glycine hydroxymethyltransferase